MKSVALRSLKIVLFTTCISMPGLFATEWQVPQEALSYNSSLGEIRVLHDDVDGWFIIDKDDEVIAVDKYLVDRKLRYAENEDLIQALGICFLDLSAIDEDTLDIIDADQIKPAAYLRITQQEDGAYSIKMNIRGEGGGPVTGLIVGGVIKGAGYTALAIYGGPVGWAVVGKGAYDTLKNFAWGFGLGHAAKLASGCSKLKDIQKATKAVQKLERAVRKSKNAGNLAKNAATLAKARNTLKTLQAADSAGKVLTLGGKIDDAKGAVDAAKNGFQLGKEGTKLVVNGVEKGVTAVACPAIAVIDLAADIGQTIGDFCPWF